MSAEKLPPRELNRDFWVKIVAALGLLTLSVYSLIAGAPGHPIYSIGMILCAFGIGARAAAQYSDERVYRDAYLVLFGIVAGLLITPLLLRWLPG